MVAEFPLDFLKFDKISFHALKTACQLDFRYRGYSDLKMCVISGLSRAHKFTAVQISKFAKFYINFCTFQTNLEGF